MIKYVTQEVRKSKNNTPKLTRYGFILGFWKLHITDPKKHLTLPFVNARKHA